MALNASAPVRQALERTRADAGKKGKALNMKQARVEIQGKECSSKVEKL